MSVDLKSFSSKELEEELDRRKEELIESMKPKPLPNPNFKPLIVACQEYLDDVYAEDGEESQENVYETAMRCVFGDDVFDIINS